MSPMYLSTLVSNEKYLFTFNFEHSDKFYKYQFFFAQVKGPVLRLYNNGSLPGNTNAYQ